MKNREIQKLQLKVNMLKHMLKLALSNNEENTIIQIQKEIQDIEEQMVKISLE